MSLSLQPERLKRYKDLAKLFFKYGRSDLAKQANLNDSFKRDISSTKHDGNGDEAERFARDLEELGPTFIKLGQLMSTRPDLVPMSFIKALARLQDKVEPVPFSEIERIIHEELGVKISKAFSEFDPQPLASASLGQVHKAKLRDGRLVAVKVQRPHIRRRVVDDLDSLGDIAEFLDSHTSAGDRFELKKMLHEFQKSFILEFDYRREAKNLETLRAHLSEFDLIIVPQPINDYTTSKVLTMEYVTGKKITSLNPLARLDINGGNLADQLFEAYLQQVLVDGYFHADPHPGNLFLTDDHRIALLDLGMIGHIDGGMQDKLLQLLIAISNNKADDTVSIAMNLGRKRNDFDQECFRSKVRHLVITNQDLQVNEIELGSILLEFTQLSGECGLRLPTELTMLAKTLLNLDQIGKSLDPGFDPNAAIRRHAAKIVQQKLLRGFSPSGIIHNVIGVKEFIEKFPGQIVKLLDNVANNDLQIKVDAIDEKKLLAGFQKIANRITLGLILAALILGAARLMEIPTQFTILGYPGLAMIFFLIAAGGGIALVISIVFSDEKPERR